MALNKLPLDPGWHRVGRTRQLLTEGYHDTRCEAAQFNETGQLEITFILTGDGLQPERRIVQRFDPERDKDLLYELLSYLGLKENARSVNINKLTDTPVRVRIHHSRHADGSYHETITGYRAVPGTP
jgi:hypothetical protein